MYAQCIYFISSNCTNYLSLFNGNIKEIFWLSWNNFIMTTHISALTVFVMYLSYSFLRFNLQIYMCLFAGISPPHTLDCAFDVRQHGTHDMQPNNVCSCHEALTSVSLAHLQPNPKTFHPRHSWTYKQISTYEHRCIPGWRARLLYEDVCYCISAICCRIW